MLIKQNIIIRYNNEYFISDKKKFTIKQKHTQIFYL